MQSPLQDKIEELSNQIHALRKELDETRDEIFREAANLRVQASEDLKPMLEALSNIEQAIGINKKKPEAEQEWW